MSIRPIKRMIRSQPTIEGAGVRLRRVWLDITGRLL
jgi:hypothetical protein